MIIQQSDFEKHKIIIDQITHEDHHEKVSLDLHIGNAYKKPADNNHYSMPSKLTLKPNETYVIQTREKFYIPDNIFGIVFPRASFSAEGLAVPNLKVDPSYSGHLFITIFNTSKNRIKINKMKQFVVLYFKL